MTNDVTQVITTTPKITNITVNQENTQIVTHSETTIVQTPSTETVVIKSINIGPQGIPGKSAYQVAVDGGFVGTEQQWLDSLKAAPSTITVNSAIALGGNRVVIATPAGAVYADSSNINHIDKIIGVTSLASSINTPTTISVQGEVFGFTNLTVGLPVFLTTNGVLSHTPPPEGNFIIEIGVALTSSSVLINIKTPIQTI